MAQNMYFPERTITTHLKIDHISDADIDDPEETLILLLELLLVEYLNRENAVLVDSPAPNPPLTPLFSHRSSSMEVTITYKSNGSFQYGFKVFLITEVVWVCSPPTVATANGSGKPMMKS